MAYEFAKLSEVPVVESVSDSGHFIAEDDGNIVRIPAKSTGGSAPIVIDSSYSEENGWVNTVTGGTYTEVRVAIENGLFPDIILRHYTYGLLRCVRILPEDEQSLIRLDFFNGSALPYLWNSNDTVSIMPL